MAVETKNMVALPCSAYNAMATKWQLIDDLLGGTYSMRKAGERWLPREPKEDDLSYQHRLNRSILFTAYADTVEDLAGKPFSEPVRFDGEIPENLLFLDENCDGQGTNITQFARRLFDTCLNRGLTHVLVDYPVTSPQEGQKLTIADEQRLGARSFFVEITPDQLIGWRFEKGNDGSPVLTQIRWKTTRIEPDGEYGERVVEEIRVMTPTEWQIHTKNEKNEYILTSVGTHTFGSIPLVTCYINKTGLMTADPPLEGLAWMNISHWQSSSDQKNLLRYARFPLLFFKGLSDEEVEKEVIIGPGRKFVSNNPEADAKYLEHSGSAITSGRQDILDIEERMALLGLEPVLSKPTGTQTATGQAIDESRSNCAIQAWIRSLEQCLTDCFNLAAQWTQIEMPDDFKVNIFNDFGVGVRATADIDALIKARQSKEIDRETFLREIRRRGLLSETADIDSIISNIESEGPDLSSINFAAQDDNNDGGNV